MDLGYGNPKANKWVANVGLITSYGPNGQDIMAAEWTYYVSYSPALISVHIGSHKTTAENIKATKEFGVSLAASDQNWISSVAGSARGREVDKIALLQELGAEFLKGKKTGVFLVKGAALHAECKLKQAVDMGDHTMFVGEVVEIDSYAGKEPLVYHQGKYFRLGANIEKPPQEFRDRIAQLKEKHTRKA
ncbi:MAG: flavin reductase family protein [Candidatus Anstonellaceae archaeon]